MTDNANSFREIGFLSPQIAVFVERHRKQNAEWFALAERLNRAAMHIIPRINVLPERIEQDSLTVTLFSRGLASFQSALILAARGLTGDARGITRGLFETAFYLGAVRKDSELYKRLVAHDLRQREKIANALVKSPNTLDQQDQAKVQEWLRRVKEGEIAPEEFGVFAAAEIAGLKAVYDTHYRGLSNDSGHPSITALNRHVVADEAGTVTGFTFGPDVPDIAETLFGLCTAAAYLVTFANDMLLEPGVSAELDECWIEYKRLVHKVAKAEPESPAGI